MFRVPPPTDGFHLHSSASRKRDEISDRKSKLLGSLTEQLKAWLSFLSSAPLFCKVINGRQYPRTVARSANSVGLRHDEA